MGKFRIWLSWIAVLPGALLAGFLAIFPLHWALYFTFVDGGIVSGVNIEPMEYLLTPFLSSLVYIYVGQAIAPKYKSRTSAALITLYFLVWLTVIYLQLLESGNSLLGGLPVLRAMLGLFGAGTGFLLTKYSVHKWNSKKQTEKLDHAAKILLQNLRLQTLRIPNSRVPDISNIKPMPLDPKERQQRTI
jgi:hypothetical protein